jgi:hypothetical protein
VQVEADKQLAASVAEAAAIRSGSSGDKAMELSEELLEEGAR